MLPGTGSVIWQWTKPLSRSFGVVEDLVEAQLRRWPPATGRKVWQDKLLKLPEAQLRGNPLTALTSGTPVDWKVFNSASAEKNPSVEPLPAKLEDRQKPKTG